MTRPVITIIYNTTIHVLKSRIRLIETLQEAGYKVVVLSSADEATVELARRGIAHRHIPMSQYSINPLTELKAMRAIFVELRKLKPVVSLHYTIKPNIFGTLAAKRAGVPVINNVAGSGRAYTTGNFLFRRMITRLYKLAFRHSSKVFFQNSDDLKTFLDADILDASKAIRIPGSGVDLDRFIPTATPLKATRFLFIGRLLKEKGIAEFLDASRRLKSKYMDAQFHIVGEHEELPIYLEKSRLDQAVAAGVVTYHGAVLPGEIETLIKDASCVVLPSYYGEGVPRVLLEACASGRPIITTDNVGCRDVIVDGENGFMVRTRDSKELERAMARFLETSEEVRSAMGQAARRKVENEFDERLVLQAYMSAINQETKAK